MRPKTICRHPGCGRAQEEPYCEKHKKSARQPYPSKPGEHAHLYNYQWTKIRRLFLKTNPLCKICASKGRTTAARVVDHVVPHKGDLGLFYDPMNLQPLCVTCHAVKTNREDGGFGNPVRTRQGGA